MHRIYDFPPPHLNLTMSSLGAKESQPPKKHTKTKSHTQDTQNKTHKKKTKKKGDHSHQLAQQHPKFHLKVDHQKRHNLISTTKHSLISTTKQKEWTERKRVEKRRVKTIILDQVLCDLNYALLRWCSRRLEEHQPILLVSQDSSPKLGCGRSS